MQEDIQNENEEVRTEPIIGQFKPKRKFLNFVSSVNGARIRFIRDIAFIKGEKLSGVLEGVIFKVTICDEGTINFEEQKGSNLSDESMIKRLITDIDDKDVTGHAQKFVVAGLEFSDINGDRCYLEVEHDKPINKLKSLFEDDDNVEVSEKSLSLLDDLFGSDDEVEEECDEDHALSEVMNSMLDDLSEEDVKTIIEVNENPTEPNDKLKEATESYMEQQFRKMNESKIIELEYRIEETQKEIIRFKNDSTQAQKKAEEKNEALGILETRLETMKPGDKSNGYVFFVSEEMKDMESLSEEETKIALKISDIMKLKGDVIVKMLTEGYYKIKIAKADDITADKVEVTKEILEKMSFDPMGKMKMEIPGEFEYRGKLDWHQLVSKMIRSGFTQEPEFDKLCNSNSYDSHEEDKSTEMDLGNGIVAESDEGFVDMGNGVFGIPPSSEKMDDYHQVPVAAMRDIKIDKLIKNKENKDMNKVLTSDQLEAVESIKNQYEIDITKNWFLFSTQSDEFAESEDFKFWVTIQLEEGDDQDPICEDFLPSNIKNNLHSYAEVVFGYDGDMSEEEFIKELDKSPFFKNIN